MKTILLTAFMLVIGISAEKALYAQESGSSAKDAQDKIQYEAFLKNLKDPDASVRAQAIYDLGQRGGADKSVIKDLLPLLKDSDAGVRQLVVEAIKRLHAKENMNDIIPLLEDENKHVRGTVLLVIEEFGGVEEVMDKIKKLLPELLAYDDSFVRNEVESVLRRHGLTEVEIDNIKHPENKNLTKEELHIRELIIKLTSNDRKAAKAELVKIGKPALPQLAKASEEIEYIDIQCREIVMEINNDPIIEIRSQVIYTGWLEGYNDGKKENPMAHIVLVNRSNETKSLLLDVLKECCDHPDQQRTMPITLGPHSINHMTAPFDVGYTFTFWNEQVDVNYDCHFESNFVDCPHLVCEVHNNLLVNSVPPRDNDWKNKLAKIDNTVVFNYKLNQQEKTSSDWVFLLVEKQWDSVPVAVLPAKDLYVLNGLEGDKKDAVFNLLNENEKAKLVEFYDTIPDYPAVKIKECAETHYLILAKKTAVIEFLLYLRNIKNTCAVRVGIDMQASLDGTYGGGHDAIILYEDGLKIAE
ncbi:MAG: HEAT repeat domain-containing protein [Planctomycetes bacterium]|nr:HEAT repeat domain-containing protein [Planctomycetota bacterium]